MVKISKVEAQKNHGDIVAAAGAAVRSLGVSGASVAVIAKSAGLTHGALYRHFPDKDALAAAAIEADFDRIVAMLDHLKVEGKSVRNYVHSYLAKDHRDHFEWGCPAAPLASEILRLDDRVQAAFCEGLHRNLAALASLIGHKDERQSHAEAIFTLSALVGAMALARAVQAKAPAFSDEILLTVCQQLDS
jgi:TetR/AcrR family transcriptional regulator, transcriptional repressor for nem operon